MSESRNRSHFTINRPVHLARRDVCFERATELIYMPIDQAGTARRLEHMAHILHLLDTAREHALFASRAPTASENEQNYLHFLQLVSFNAQSVHSMLNHQSHLEIDEGALHAFLGISAADAALPALHYRRRAEDILQGLTQIMKRGNASYRSLQKQNLDALDEGDRVRYKKAYESTRKEIDAMYRANLSAPKDD